MWGHSHDHTMTASFQILFQYISHHVAQQSTVPDAGSLVTSHTSPHAPEKSNFSYFNGVYCQWVLNINLLLQYM
jgi:hypothetical protein